MNIRLAVDKVPPKLIKHVRQVFKGEAEAAHPVYDVTEHKGTGKATCRGCGEIIKEGDPALLFWNARYDKGHKLDFIKDRSVIHAEGCTDGPLVRCPHPGCGDELAEGTLSQHIENAHADRFKWQVRPKAASIKVTCLLHKKAHCGQCEEDRELEIPKFREELKKLLEVTASVNDQEILEYFDEPYGYVEDPDDFTKRAAPYKSRPTRDIAQEVTDRVISALEKGTVPWKRPWTSRGNLPTSVHGRSYRGINLLLLGLEQQEKGYEHPYWVTFDQAKKMGGTVKKGEKGTLVTFRKQLKVPDRDAVPEVGKDPKMKTVPLLRHYTVFNIGQTEGIQLPPRLENKMKPREKVEVLPSVISILEGYKGGPPIRHISMESYMQDAPHYHPGKDEIVLPYPDQFDHPEDYAGTVMHEATHSTGHDSRLGRFKESGESLNFGNEPYAKEELVAELGSAMLLGHVGIESQHERNNAYIGGWIERLKNDKNLIIGAAGKAQNAVDHILGVNPAEFTNDEEESGEKTAAKWRHTDNDGFEMWETTEKHNEYAIVESDNKYDLYVLKGSFDSPEEAKAAANTQKTSTTSLPPDVIEAFTSLGEQQRGEGKFYEQYHSSPEFLMTDLQQKHGGGPFSWLAEHTGDLIHRMAYTAANSFGLNYAVSEKINKVFGHLSNDVYGQDRDYNENLTKNAKSLGLDPTEYINSVEKAANAYAEAHRQLPVYNRPLWLGREAAVAIGERRFSDATKHVTELKTMLDNESIWAELSKVERDADGNLKQYSPNIERTAQDGGGGGGASGGGGGSGGGDGGSSGGDGGGDAGSSTSGDGADSGNAGFSSDTSDSDSDDSNNDGDEDPRPPSDSSCPRCGHELNPIYLIGGRVYTCMSCGYTQRKNKRKNNYELEAESRYSAWFDRVKSRSSEQPSEESEILSINPQLPPILMSEEPRGSKTPKNTAELFSMSSTRFRYCGVCGKALNSSSRGAYTGVCEADRERLGLVTHEPGSRDNRAGRQ